MKGSTELEKKTIIRPVKFDYFQLVCVESDGNGNTKELNFDFIQWMNLMNNIIDIEDRTIRHYGERIRIDEIKIDGESGFGLLHFSRLRESNIPTKTLITKKELEDIGLGDDEYIAEDISALYDEENYVLMLQRNVHSLSPSGVAEYINYFWNDSHPNHYVELRPVMKLDSFNDGFGKDIFRKIVLKTADTPAKVGGVFDKLTTPCGRAFRELEALEGVNIEITVSASRSKENLNFDEVIEALNELKANQALFEKAKISGKDTEESKVEVVDLLDGKVQSVIQFTIPLKKALASNIVQAEMIHEYSALGRDKKREIVENKSKKK